jgi:serine/threonine protein kinase
MITCGDCGTPNFVAADLRPGGTAPCGRCGAQLMVPFFLRHFEVRQPIAAGGMGMVFRAFDTILHRAVAVKLLRQELAHDRRKVEEFYHEARVCAALNHPHIIQIFHFGEFEAMNFIAMELADHGSIETRLAAESRLPELAVLDAGIQIAGALDAAMNQGYLHRDIKPANILFNAAGEAKLADFGLARRIDAAVEFSEVIWGTPDYSSPERIRRQPETFHSDLYALGATLYHALTGRAPFTRDSVEATLQAHLGEPVVPPIRLVPGISEVTNDAIVRTLAKEPGERFASYDELVMALTAARSELLVGNVKGNKPLTAKTGPARPLTSAFRKTPSPRPQAAPQPEPPPERMRPRRRRSKARWLVPAVAVIAAAAVVAGLKVPWLRGKAREFASLAPAVTAEPSPDPATSAPAAPANAPAKAKAAGARWVSLSGPAAPKYWRGLGMTNFPAGAWKHDGSNLTASATARTLLVTREKFKDFELQFDWKAESNTLSAVLFALHEPRPKQPLKAFKIPLGDDAKAAAPNQATGALAGLAAPAAGKRLKPLGEFNATRLIVLGNEVVLLLNARKILEFDLDRADPVESPGSPRAARTANKPSTDGHLALQPGPGIVFRNVRVRPITEWPALPRQPEPKAAPVTKSGEPSRASRK